MDEWNPDKIITYRFVSDYAVITFSVPGMSDWDEDRFDDAAITDLESYVLNPEAYSMDDCWNEEGEK